MGARLRKAWPHGEAKGGTAGDAVLHAGAKAPPFFRARARGGRPHPIDERMPFAASQRAGLALGEHRAERARTNPWCDLLLFL